MYLGMDDRENLRELPIGGDHLVPVEQIDKAGLVAVHPREPLARLVAAHQNSHLGCLRLRAHGGRLDQTRYKTCQATVRMMLPGNAQQDKIVLVAKLHEPVMRRKKTTEMMFFAGGTERLVQRSRLRKNDGTIRLPIL